MEMVHLNLKFVFCLEFMDRLFVLACSFGGKVTWVVNIFESVYLVVSSEIELFCLEKCFFA